MNNFFKLILDEAFEEKVNNEYLNYAYSDEKTIYFVKIKVTLFIFPFDKPVSNKLFTCKFNCSSLQTLR